MQLLLDTQIFLWWFSSPEKISKNVHTLLEDEQNQLFLSAVSALEIAIKARLKKLSLPDEPSIYLLTRMAVAKIHPLAISIEHALGVGDLEAIHEDPFDRLLISQAKAEGMGLVTSDKTILKYSIRTIKA